MPATKHLSVMQLRYKQNRLKGMSQKDSALAAGYSEKSLACQVERLVRASLLEELDLAGATDQRLAKELVAVALVKPEKVFASDKLKALEQICKLKGHVTDHPPVIDQSAHTYFTVVVPQEQDVAAHRDRDVDAETSLCLSAPDQS